jgi:erythronate-4-phosphate dehydrogenase
MAKPIHIVADENIPGLKEVLPSNSTFETYSGRDIKPEHLVNADVLMVRSVTKVNESLLKDSSVKFVGTCTIGVDHIDIDYLQRSNIAFASAPGCNANAVVDYVLSAMLYYKSLEQWRGLTAGVVGYGQVGKRLVSRLQALGIKTLYTDPYESDAKQTLKQVLSCDIISLHVPLTTDEKDSVNPTFHLISHENIHLIQSGSLLINTSRGAVIDNAVLQKALEDKAFTCVLDVFEEEPEPKIALLDQLLLSTGHIAGYSLQGKLRGTTQVVEQLYEFLGLDITYEDQFAQHESEVTLKNVSAETVIKSIYNIGEDSRLFRNRYDEAFEEGLAKEAFDEYRKSYPVRREFSSVRLLGDIDKDLCLALGFRQ